MLYTWSCTFRDMQEDIPDDAICNIVIHANDNTYYSKCGKVSDLWQQLERKLTLNLIHETLWNEVGGGLLISMMKNSFDHSKKLWCY